MHRISRVLEHVQCESSAKLCSGQKTHSDYHFDAKAGEMFQFGTKLPREVTGPSAWFGPQKADREETWLYHFTRDDITEIEAALQHCTATQSSTDEVDINRISRESFPLPKFANKLAKIRAELLDGQGFFLLRGLPIQQWTRWQTCVVYLGIGKHIGDPVPQNRFGHVLGHVKDLGDDPTQPGTRIYRTRARQRYHTDSCDIVGLLCLRQSKSGGRSSIASSMTVYNELYKRSPLLLSQLTQPITFDRKGAIPKGRKPFYKSPLFNFHKGIMSCYFTPTFVEAAPKRNPLHVPPMTKNLKDAIAAMEEIAADDRVVLKMDFQPGDIQLVQNHQILHARGAYDDYSDPSLRRHLLRLWLSTCDGGRPLADCYRTGRYSGGIVGPIRGGIVLDNVPLFIPLEAE